MGELTPEQRFFSSPNPGYSTRDQHAHQATPHIPEALHYDRNKSDLTLAIEHYRPEIDGLRAIAVLPVILFHAEFSLFSGGYVGVDVFFVISGYLITTIILREMNEGRFRLIDFYERRARRILPALFTVLLACLPFVWLLLDPDQLRDFGQNALATSLFSSNILLWLKNGYFAAGADMNPLLHTWSLAVEEQYYIAFPLLLMIVGRWERQNLLAWLIVAFTLSLFASWWASLNAPKAGFYLLPFRGWELLLGSFCALLIPKLPTSGHAHETLAFAGLAMIAVAVVAFDSQTPFPGLHALLPTVGTALVILFARRENFVQRLLSQKPLVAVGLISYSAYLWHQPTFAFFRHHYLGHPSAIIMLLLALASMLLAAASWYFVERPFRNRGMFSRRFIFTTSAALAFSFSAAGLFAHFHGGFLARDIDRPDLQAFQSSNGRLQQQSWELLRRRTGDAGYLVDQNAVDQKPWFDLSDPRARILVIGDSHSKDLYNVLHYSKTVARQAQLARYGLQLEALADPDHDFFNSPNYRQAEVVVIAAFYSDADLAALRDVIDVLATNGKKIVLTSNTFNFEQFGDRTLAGFLLLRAHRSGTLPDKPADMARRINAEHYRRLESDKGDRSERASVNNRLRAMADRAHVYFENRMDYICSDAERLCYAIDDTYQKHFYDYGHHTLEGAEFFAGRADRIGWTDRLVGVVNESPREPLAAGPTGTN